MTKETKTTSINEQKVKERLIKEVQKLSAAKHTKKELNKMPIEDLQDIIDFKKWLIKKYGK